MAILAAAGGGRLADISRGPGPSVADTDADRMSPADAAGAADAHGLSVAEVAGAADAHGASLAEVADRMVRIERTLEPRPERTARYFEIYCRMVDELQRRGYITAQLAATARRPGPRPP
jgi:hypothetical protein